MNPTPPPSANTSTNATGRNASVEEKVAGLLRMLDQAQTHPAFPHQNAQSAPSTGTPITEAPAEEPAASPRPHHHPAPEAPANPGPATWMLDSPAVDPALAQASFATLHPACRGEILEEFRSIRTRVYLERKAWFDQGADLRTLAIVSPTRRSGKSFTAANLAAVLAATGDNRVLLIDANPASPTLGTHLGLSSPTGLCEVLQGQPWYRHLHRVEPTPLYVMPFGATRTNTVDSFDYTALPVWLHDLRASFDWIILDGPAFDTPSDAQLLTNFADATLLTVRKHETQYAQVQEALRRIPRERLIGAIATPGPREKARK